MSAIGSVPDLDPVIHAQARLRLTVALAALAAGDQITFPRLQQLLEMSAGNLSTHLRKLEDAGYVQITKTYQRRTPVTYVALTRIGRRALEDYTRGTAPAARPTDQPTRRLRWRSTHVPFRQPGAMARSLLWTPSRSRSRPGSCSACSARTAPARPPCFSSWRGCAGPARRGEPLPVR
jgi:hypothetical protein